MCPKIAIVTFDTNIIREAAPNNVPPHRDSVSAAATAELLAMFRTPTPYMPYRQKKLFCFATARTYATVVVIDHLFQLSLILLLTPKGQFIRFDRIVSAPFLLAFELCQRLFHAPSLLKSGSKVKGLSRRKAQRKGPSFEGP